MKFHLVGRHERPLLFYCEMQGCILPNGDLLAVQRKRESFKTGKILLLVQQTEGTQFAACVVMSASRTSSSSACDVFLAFSTTIVLITMRRPRLSHPECATGAGVKIRQLGSTSYIPRRV